MKKHPGKGCLPLYKSILRGSLLFLCPTVLIGMKLGCFICVMGCIKGMPMRNLGMMASLLVIPRFVMLGRFTMMVRGLLVMLGRLVVVLGAFVCRHS
jgi:hypothetical protein